MNINKLPQGKRRRKHWTFKADSLKKKRVKPETVLSYKSSSVCVWLIWTATGARNSGQVFTIKKWLVITNAWRPYEEILLTDNLAEKKRKHFLCVYLLLKVKAKHKIIQTKLQTSPTLGWRRRCSCWLTHLFIRLESSRTSGTSRIRRCSEGLVSVAHRQG